MKVSNLEGKLNGKTEVIDDLKTRMACIENKLDKLFLLVLSEFIGVIVGLLFFVLHHIIK